MDSACRVAVGLNELINKLFRRPLLGSGFEKRGEIFLIEVLYYFVHDKEVEVEY